MKTPKDTIVAIATPLGPGGLGVVRLSGPDALRIGAGLFGGADLETAGTHTLHRGWILRTGIPVDDVVAGVFRAPRSYTGEDVVEFSCHGSPLILRELVTLSCQAGARPALPGEFTQRAYLNGKMDLAQAEAVAELVAAGSERARAAALAQLRGTLSREIGAMRRRLVDILAEIEAGLDFMEDTAGANDPAMVRDAIVPIARMADALLATAKAGQALRDGFRIALLGRPNAGKSSLFNALLGRERAIVTAVPGTTRDTLEERIAWRGFSLVLTDTAGLRETKNAVEALGVARAKRAVIDADAILFVADGSAPLTEADDDLARLVVGRPVLPAHHKCDRLAAFSVEALTTRYGWSASVATSAVTGAGLEALKDRMVALANAGLPESEDAPIVTTLRHRDHVEKARAAIHRAMDQAGAPGFPEEAVAAELRSAARELGAITGETIDEDVLSAIFQKFCIGK